MLGALPRGGRADDAERRSQSALRLRREAALLLPLHEGRPAESTGVAHRKSRRSVRQLPQETHRLPLSGEGCRDEGAEDVTHAPFEAGL